MCVRVNNGKIINFPRCRFSAGMEKRVGESAIACLNRSIGNRFLRRARGVVDRAWRRPASEGTERKGRGCVAEQRWGRR